MNTKQIFQLCTACAVLVPGRMLAGKAPKAPNIIFILTDDQRWDAMGCAGNSIIQTPEMDRLAREGVFFRNAFSSTPVSAASRASILAGVYERTHGYTFGTGDLKEEFLAACYPVRLHEKGYYTGFFGKFGVNCKNMKELFDEFDNYDRNGRFRDRRGYFYKTIDGDTVHLTQYTGYQARKFIEHAPADRPFCLSLSFSAPHAHDEAKEQYFWQEKSNGLYRDIKIPAPLLKESHYFTALPQGVQEGFNRSRWWWRYDTPEKYQHSMKGYYRMISEIDDEIGKIRKLLDEKELSKNTVIIFMGDNGLFLGERQLAGKWLMYEPSIHIPLIVYDPRSKLHREVKDMVLNIDVPCTILDYAGAPVPEIYQGKSLRPYAEGAEDIKPREAILIEHLWKNRRIPASEGVRTRKWKYFRYRYLDAPEELYDLELDPMETRNLAEEGGYRCVLESMRNLCDRKIGEVSCK